MSILLGFSILTASQVRMEDEGGYVRICLAASLHQLL